MNQVGRYQIVGELGRGTTGVVYRALDPAIGRTVAIKSIDLSQLNESEKQRIRDRLLREARSAGVLSHPNIVTIYDVQESDECANIFMEYVDGASLEDLVRRQAVPDRKSFLQFLRNIADALDYAHRKGIIHRDIKPANIIIAERRPDAEPLAKVADFGIAKFTSQEMTHHGTVIGTPNYMSPEQIQSMTVTGASDQFSLAVLTYQFLCGELPFVADSMPALFYLISKQSAKPVNEVNSTLSATVQMVMRRAMAKQPEERFGNCCEFIGSLEIALADCLDWVPLAAETANQHASIVYATPPPGLQSETEPGEQNGSSPDLNGSVTRPTSPKQESGEQQRTLARRDQFSTQPLMPRSNPTVPTGEAQSGERAYAKQELSLAAKIGLFLALCLAVGITAVLIVKMNSGPTLPVQVLDPKLGPSMPPPPEDLRSARQPGSQPLDLSAPGSALAVNPNPPVAASTGRSAGKPSAASAPNESGHRSTANTAPASHAGTTPRGSHVPEGSRAVTADAVSEVELSSDPPGAAVTVDKNSSMSCATPCSLLLPAGRHTLAAELPGYAVTRKIFRVPEEASLILTMSQSSGVLLVTTIPPGSGIAIDGKDYGQTPVTIHLTPGAHHLSLWDGSRRHDETIEVDPDRLQTHTFRW